MMSTASIRDLAMCRFCKSRLSATCCRKCSCRAYPIAPRSPEQSQFSNFSCFADPRGLPCDGTMRRHPGCRNGIAGLSGTHSLSSLTKNRDMELPCYECALRACGLFKPVTPEELSVINQIKREHLSLPAGAEIIRAGESAPEIYTLYSGWAFRFKTLPDGRRQILNFLLPGDLLGLQAAMFDAAQHGIEALTEVQLCLLPRRKVWGLFGEMPGLAFDVAWL